MDLQDLKWWVWAIIGLVIGLGLSYSYSNWDRSRQYTPGSMARFQANLLRAERRADGDPPRITAVRLHPTVDPAAQRITYSQIEEVGENELAYVTYELVATSPLRVETPNGTEYNRRNPAPSLRAYLDAVKAANPEFDYSYAFWEEKPWTYAIFTTLSVLLIGGAWPVVLRFLVGAGFGRPPKEKDDYDLSRFGKGTPEPAAAAARKPAADEADLAAVTAAYESRLGKGVDEDEEIESAIAEAQATGSQSEIRKLAGGSAAEELPLTPAQEEEEKEYVGEFYPVARTHKPSSEDADEQ